MIFPLVILGSLGISVSSFSSWIQERTSLLDSSPCSGVSKRPSERRRTHMCDAEPQHVPSKGALREDRGTTYGCQCEASVTFGLAAEPARQSPRADRPRRRRPAPSSTVRSQKRLI